MAKFVLPHCYDLIKIVSSFDELIGASMSSKINALCWPRTLVGNFDELAVYFANDDDITSLDETLINEARKNLSPDGQTAADSLVADLTLFQNHGLSPNLECVTRYARDEGAEIIPTDVYSFHVDRATIATDTYLCSYNEASSQGLRNDFAQRHIDIPTTREKLFKQFCKEGGKGDFDLYLQENCYDLHYAPLDDKAIFSFGLGNIWRIAVDYPGAFSLPCIHRAPATIAGRPSRLLLIS